MRLLEGDTISTNLLHVIAKVAFVAKLLVVTLFIIHVSPNCQSGGNIIHILNLELNFLQRS